MRVEIAADQDGAGLKEELRAHLRQAGHGVVDFGANRLNPEKSQLRTRPPRRGSERISEQGVSHEQCSR